MDAPDEYENGAVHYDSDDENLAHMDHGVQNVQKKPWDFNSEAEWEAYNQQKETLPKAAFQFGQKVADGRTSKLHQKRAKGGDGDDKAKFEKEYQQISAIMKRKAASSAGTLLVQSSSQISAIQTRPCMMKTMRSDVQRYSA